MESSPRRPAQAPPKARRIDRRLPPETVAELVAAYEAGTGTPELCKRYSISEGSILKLLTDHGIQMRRQGLTDTQIRRAEKLYADGNSLRTIANQLGSSFSTVREALIARGVQMRPARK
ncbi:helix-turn-helix domain-containing protein [Nocardia wallacei]|uniref:helix-turn-helix domain-containing protein n=1 Tax=Nocardia wallacei TaxID=480035 RepID=UPI0024577A14|nr:helix-turn-helix domain-containing protein [Nocardia wallacei]